MSFLYVSFTVFCWASFSGDFLIFLLISDSSMLDLAHTRSSVINESNCILSPERVCSKFKKVLLQHFSLGKKTVAEFGFFLTSGSMVNNQIKVPSWFRGKDST